MGNENSIEVYEKMITLFYSLNTGEIKLSAGGKQDMDYFGRDKHDYNYGFLVVERDEFLVNNLSNFLVVDGVLQLKEDSFISKYVIK
ncbi:hypothetical protein QTH49_13135 [Clostridium perfringens]|nr:hypothetical protein [Clostridium perfringens]MDM0528398.1 hypothetical protein [Clostridium perfringens]